MIITIIIFTISLYWLMLETDWLRVNLKYLTEVNRLVTDEDYQPDYDGSDLEYLVDYDAQFSEALANWEYEQGYQEWLEERYKVTYTTRPQADRDQLRRMREDYLDSPLYQHYINPTCEKEYWNKSR